MPTLNPGDSIQAATTANPAGTTFTLNPGVYTLSSSIVPKSGNSYLGVSGAILDGTGWVTTDSTQGAFRAHNVDINTVTISERGDPEFRAKRRLHLQGFLRRLDRVELQHPPLPGGGAYLEHDAGGHLSHPLLSWR